MAGEIHDEHPFADPEDQRDPIRRFRGRLSAPVTIVTAGSQDSRTGLTVSSLVLAGDDEPKIHFVLGPDSYLWDAIQASGKFVVHILDASQHALSDQFAGIRPSPGGPFARVAVSDSAHGPVLASCPTRAYCALGSVVEGDGYLLVGGVVESVDLHDLTTPLQWFRGSYRELAER